MRGAHPDDGEARGDQGAHGDRRLRRREGAQGPAHEQQEAAALGQAGPAVAAEQLVPGDLRVDAVHDPADEEAGRGGEERRREEVAGREEQAHPDGHAGDERRRVHAEVDAADREVDEQEARDPEGRGRHRPGAHVGRIVPLVGHRVEATDRGFARHRPNGRCGMPGQPMPGPGAIRTMDPWPPPLPPRPRTSAEDAIARLVGRAMVCTGLLGLALGLWCRSFSEGSGGPLGIGLGPARGPVGARGVCRGCPHRR